MSRTPVPKNTSRSKDESVTLEQFAAFVRKNWLDVFVRRELELFEAYQLPLLKHISHFSADDIFRLTKQSGERFLLAVERNQYEDLVRENYDRWMNDQLEFVGKEQISLQDILIINSAQKVALLEFIPEFTSNPKDSVQIVANLELMHQRAQLEAVILLEELKSEGEQKFRETEERYRDLFDNASDMIHFVTPEGKLLYVNPAWKRTLGYNDEELAGESLYFFICSKDRERFRAYRNRILEGQPNNDPIQISFLTKDNREIIAEGIVSVKSKNDSPEYTRGIFKDVTRRVQNEEKLQFYTQQVLEREEKLKQLIASAPDAIIVVNENDVINIWNPKAEEIFGWKAGEVLGSPLCETIIPESQHTAYSRGMQRLLHNGDNILNRTIEVTAVKKDGSQLVVSMTISKAVLPQGPLFVSFLRDITAQKQNEWELEQQRIQLQRTNHELEQYAWVTSHDLKEPLRKIRTFSDMLLNMQGTALQDDAVNKLKKIHDSAVRMDSLIEAILLYSHSSPDQAFEPVDLNETLGEVFSDLEIAISNKNATIEMKDLPLVRGIPFQLRQLFQNLISNALKYSKPSVAPVIHVQSAKQGKYYRITVTDNGIGFKEEFASKIFQVFQRLVGKHEYEGTGIGLALCKKIAENHGGSIKAYSKEGVGSSFEVMLPLS